MGLFTSKSVVVGALLLVTTVTVKADIAFEDRTDTALGGFLTETWGASWGDFNGDHWPDLFVGNHRQRPSLYRNNGDGTFSNVILQADRTRGWLSNRYIDHHGAAFTDIDGDGDDDLLSSTNGCCPAQLMISDGKLFSDEASQRGVANDGAGWSVSWLDYNGDGPIDLARMSFRTSELFDQNIGGNFSNGPSIACEQNNYGQLSDLNGDGSLDFICAREGTFPQRIYSVANGVPEDITSSVPAVSNTVDTIIADFDGDLRTDIFALRGMMLPNQAKAVSANRIEASLDASPSQGEAGFSFQADGIVELQVFSRFSNVYVYPGANGGQFTTSSKEKITLDPNDVSFAGMRTTRGGQRIYVGYDVSSKTWTVWQTGTSGYFGGWWFVYMVAESASTISNVQSLNQRDVDLPIKPRMLSTNNGSWKNITWDAGFRDELLCSAATTGDYDNDMDLDMYLVCRNGVENIANRLFENDGSGKFTEVIDNGAEGAVGVGLTSNAGIGETVVTADYDNDGFLDLMVTNGLNTQPVRVGGPHQIFRNSGNDNHWVALTLRGTTSNPSAVGAQVLATAGGITQLREQNGGYHRWSQDHQRLHFGLADNTSVDLTVKWPGGAIETFSGVAADSFYEVVEGSGIEAVVAGPVSDFDPPISGDECGEPAYLTDLDQALFVWKDCGSGEWHVRATAGGASEPLTYLGAIDIDTGGTGQFSSFSKKSFESSDSIDFSSSRIDFAMTTAGAGEDGFSMSLTDGDPGCLSLSTPSGTRIFLGASHIEVSAPFSLSTLEGCSGDPTLSMESMDLDESAGVAEMKVMLVPASDSVVTVKASTVAASAVAGSDFYGAFESLVFQPGETEKTIVVSLIDDAVVEPTETLSIRLFQNNGAPIATPMVPINIIDNDSGVATLTVVSQTVSEADGQLDVVVVLSQPSNETVSVQLASKAGSARGGSDFYGSSEVLTFSPGETRKTKSFTLINDAVAEPEETMKVRAFNATGPVSVATPEVEMTITDDD